MIKNVSYYLLIHFFLSFASVTGAFAVPLHIHNPYNQKRSNFSTLVKSSLEAMGQQAQNPISLSLLDLLSKKTLPTSDMGQLKVFSQSDYLAISIEGDIYKNLDSDIAFFLQKHDKNKNKALIFLINSPGGYTLPIKKMQTSIDRNRLTTVVTGQALSSAALLFLLGKQKLMLPHTELGFHASHIRGKIRKPIDSFMLNNNFADKIIDKLNKSRWQIFLKNLYRARVFHSADTKYYTAEKLDKEKLVQKVDTNKIILDKFWDPRESKITNLYCKKMFL